MMTPQNTGAPMPNNPKTTPPASPCIDAMMNAAAMLA
jgi:hypothetical protein